MRINNKYKFLILTLVFSSFLSYPSFQQNEEELREDGDSWNFDYEFAKDLILIGIPTAIGIYTTKTITNSWQKRKEKAEIRRKIIDEYDNSILRYTLRIATFDRVMHSMYTKMTSKTYLGENATLHNNIINFPDDEKELPQNKLKNEYIEMSKDIEEIFNLIWRFQSSLQFYYKDEKLNKQCSSLISSIRPVLFELQKMYFSETKTEFKTQHNIFGEKYTELHNQLKEFRKVLFNTKLDEENMK